MKGGEGRTLFTQSNLAELASPVAPHPVSNTSSASNRDDDREEDSNARWTIFLVEFVALAWTLPWDTLVHFLAQFASRDGDTPVPSGIVPFDNVFTGAGLRMIWRCVTLNEFTGAVGLAFIVEITILPLVKNHEG